MIGLRDVAEHHGFPPDVEDRPFAATLDLADQQRELRALVDEPQQPFIEAINASANLGQ